MRVLPVALVAAASALSHAGISSFDTSTAVLLGSASQEKYTADPFQATDGKLRVWNERQDFTLTSALTVDAAAAGTYDSFTDLPLVSPTIAAGTHVDSQYLVFDPKNSDSVTATVGFASKILGVIVTSDRASGDRLLGSDFLALGTVPSGNLPTAHYAERGLEFRLFDSGTVQDAFTINANNSLTVNLSALTPGDQVRVVTQAVPEPSSVAALGLGALALLRRRRK